MVGWWDSSLYLTPDAKMLILLGVCVLGSECTARADLGLCTQIAQIGSQGQNRKMISVFCLFVSSHSLPLHFLFSFKLTVSVMLKVLSCSVVIGLWGSIQQHAEHSKPSAIKHASACLELWMWLFSMGISI